jgi:hypothetical protein
MSILRRIMFWMSELPDWVFLLQPFVWHPERSLLVAAAFVAGYMFARKQYPRAVRWPLLLPAVTWAAFTIWEWHCLNNQANIRIDLLLIYPVLVLATLAGLLPTAAGLARAFRAESHRRGQIVKRS